MTRNILYNGALVLLALIVLAGIGGPAAAQHLGDAASSGAAGDAPEMEATDLEPGEYNLMIATADDSKTRTLTVEDHHECNRYVDEDDIATLGGALNAIDDYENGDLSLDRVLLVIDSYELQVPLQDLTEDQDGGSTLTWCY
jgi:hypothetical protein